MSKPNIFVMGAMHTGTRYMVQALEALGWKAVRPFQIAFEYKPVWMMNRDVVIRNRKFDGKGAVELLKKLRAEEPWVIKDPCLVFTLHLWKAVLDELQPGSTLLVRTTRPFDSVVDSYIRRDQLNPNGSLKGNGIGKGLRPEDMDAKSDQQFRKWEGPKVSIDYEQIRAAVELFKPREDTDVVPEG